MGLFSSKPRYLRVIRIEAPDAQSFDGAVALIEQKAPDIMGYTGTKARMIKSGPTEGMIVIEGRDEAQMETHVSMTGELREELTRKFNLSFTPAEGKIVWTH